MQAPEYTYRAIVTRIIDGDTVEAMVDLGFGATLKMKLRLYGVNAPEVVGQDRTAGLAAARWLSSEVLGKMAIIQTRKDRTEKYGRYLATIWLGDVNINEKLIEYGHGEAM